MSVLDIVILILMIPAIIRGISKGLIEQVVAFASLFVSAYLAYLFADNVGNWLSQYITVSPSVLYVLSFVIVIVVTVLVFNLCAKLISKVIDTISLGWLNKGLGLVFAIFNTALIIGLLLRIFTDFNTNTMHLSTQWMDESLLYGWIKGMTDAIFPFLENLFSTISNAATEI